MPRRPASVSPDDSPNGDRNYLLLEEFDVVELLDALLDGREPDLMKALEDALPTGEVTVYRLLGNQLARNALQARRRAATRAYSGDERVPARLVAVPVKNWQPGPVNRSQQLSVG